MVSQRTVWLGAVAYDPKVVTIWEGMRRYFHEEAHLPVEVVLFQTYEAQVQALLADGSRSAPAIDIAWNTNLAYLQATEWSGRRSVPIAMRDTDLGWTTKIIALTGGAVRSLDDLRGRTLALGSRDSGHAAILPVHFLAERGLREAIDYTALRFNSDVGKHGEPEDPRGRQVDRCALCSTAAPMPARSGVHSGPACERAIWCRQARSPKSGRARRTRIACSPRVRDSSPTSHGDSPTRSTP